MTKIALKDVSELLSQTLAETRTDSTFFDAQVLAQRIGERCPELSAEANAVFQQLQRLKQDLKFLDESKLQQFLAPANYLANVMRSSNAAQLSAAAPVRRPGGPVLAAAPATGSLASKAGTDAAEKQSGKTQAQARGRAFVQGPIGGRESQQTDDSGSKGASILQPSSVAPSSLAPPSLAPPSLGSTGSSEEIKSEGSTAKPGPVPGAAGVPGLDPLAPSAAVATTAAATAASLVKAHATPTGMAGATTSGMDAARAHQMAMTARPNIFVTDAAAVSAQNQGGQTVGLSQQSGLMAPGMMGGTTQAGYPAGFVPGSFPPGEFPPGGYPSSGYPPGGFPPGMFPSGGYQVRPGMPGAGAGMAVAGMPGMAYPQAMMGFQPGLSMQQQQYLQQRAMGANAQQLLMHQQMLHLQQMQRAQLAAAYPSQVPRANASPQSAQNVAQNSQNTQTASQTNPSGV